MKKYFTGPIFLLIMATLFFSCAAEKSLSTPRQPLPSPNSQLATEKATRAEWEIQWEKTLSEAKKEGKVVIYTSFPPQARNDINAAFEKRTGIRTEHTTGRGAEVSTKLLNERRAGLNLADIILGGSTTSLGTLKPAGALAPIKPLLFLPEVLDETLWYGRSLPYMDRDHMVMQLRMMPGGSIINVVYNTALIKKEQLVSWYDLLKPELKGKMSLQDPTTPGKGGKWFNKSLTYFGLDEKYMRALAAQEPTIIRDLRLQIDWVVKGKHVLAIEADPDIYREYKDAGAPIDGVIFKESKDILGGGYSAFSVVAKPANPAAAKIFTNWFLSKEGQTVFSRAFFYQSAREDVPTDHLPSYQIRQPNASYAIETEEFILQEAKLMPLANAIFGPLIK